jgi:hypothetical protein
MGLNILMNIHNNDSMLMIMAILLLQGNDFTVQMSLKLLKVLLYEKNQKP